MFVLQASKLISTLSILYILLAFCQTVPLMQQQIGHQIFHDNKIYVVYVCEQSDLLVNQFFQKYCEGGNLCAILNRQVENYDAVRTFVGETKKEQYFLIIDSARRTKYILPIIEGMTETDLHIFYSKFQRNQLQPFRASQQPDPHPYKPCRKVVGTDLQSFLNEQTPVKVVFLYTQHEVCDVCGQMLRLFGDMAEKMYDQSIVSFAYYDIFLNDNPIITDQILPYFLIFVEGEDQPYGIDGDKMDELYQTIVELVMKDTDIDVTKYRKQAMDKIRESMEKGELQDIKTMEDLQKYLKQNNIELQEKTEGGKQVSIEQL